MSYGRHGHHHHHHGGGGGGGGFYPGYAPYYYVDPLAYSYVTPEQAAAQEASGLRVRAANAPSVATSAPATGLTTTQMILGAAAVGLAAFLLGRST